MSSTESLFNNLVSLSEHISLTTAFARTFGMGKYCFPTNLGSFGTGAYQSTASGLADLVGDTDFQQFPIKPYGMPGPGGATCTNYPAHFNPKGAMTAMVTMVLAVRRSR